MAEQVEQPTTPVSNSNPQGKGLVPVLGDWQQFTPRDIRATTPQRALADYFTSMLVLSAEFHFKPVIGQHYYLYYRAGRWLLSLIEPRRWHPESAGECLGQCELHSDMTWSIEPLQNTGPALPVQQALQRFAEQLSHHVAAESGQQILPFCQASLPYYRRLAASGLARSLAENPAFSPEHLQRSLNGAQAIALFLPKAPSPGQD